MQLLYLVLACFAYRGLLAFGSEADLSRELEEWFFIPTETSPVVVVLLAGWLIYRRSGRLASLANSPAAWGLAVPLLALALASFAWSLKTLAPHLLAISLLFGVLATAGIHFGRSGMRIVLLPALLLLFAMPMPAPQLAEVLYRFQLWTAEASGWLLFAMGKAAFVSGDQVLLAEDHFQVIEGCSGLRSVQTLTMVALLLVELFGRRGWHAVSIVVLAPVLAFALNGFRVLALILNPHSEVVAIHNLQGVAILLAGLAVLYAVDGVLERYGKQVEDTETDRSTASGALAGVRTRAAVVGSTLAAMCLLSVVLQPWQIPSAEPISGRDLATEIGGRSSKALDTDRSFLGTIGYRTVIDRRYEDPGGSVDLFVLMGDIDQRYRSPISPKTTPPGSGWIREAQGELDRSPAMQPSWSVMRTGARRVLVHHWYEGSAGLGDELIRALVALDASPWHRESDVLVVRLSTDVVGVTAGALDAARARLSSFQADLEPELERIRSLLSRKRLS
ncbi:MAG: exosortase/archaeosortase family protein [Myxococcota bacterium]|nr:exosortase/archaeosortase family protein [Myxococcota bacterium]